MPDSAVIQVQDLLKAELEAIPLTVFTDRDDDDKVLQSEAPCVVIEEAGIVLQFPEGTVRGSTVWHDTTFLLTAITVDAAGSSKKAAAHEMIGQIVARLDIDPTLGGKVQDVLPLNYGGENAQGNAIGGVPLEIKVQFCTPKSDWTQLI